MKTRRPHQRKQEILDAAVALSKTLGYLNVTRKGIALRALCSEAAVSAHFGTMKKLQRAVMSAAIARRELSIISQGLAAGDSKARAACQEIKEAAIATLL